MESEQPEPSALGREPRGVLVLRTLAMPRDTNPWGDIFGGWLLSQMDVAAGLMAGEVAQGRSATVTVEVRDFDNQLVGEVQWAAVLEDGRWKLQDAPLP